MIQKEGRIIFFIATVIIRSHYPAAGLNEFLEDGFSLRGGSNYVNGSGRAYVAWSFQKRPGFMDIVEYEGDDVNGREIKHRLGCKAGMVIVKDLDENRDWVVNHIGIDGTKESASLNNSILFSRGDVWRQDLNDAEDSFRVGDSAYANKAGQKYIAYVFADGALDDSIIKCGSYTGNSNSSSTQAVDCGFKAGYVLAKPVDAAEYWAIVDAERGMPQTNTPTLRANEELQEVAGSEVGIAQDDNGFVAGGGKFNRDGDRYVYMAIKAPPPPPPGPWGTEALSGNRTCWFKMDMAGVTFPTDDFTVETWFKSFGGPNHGSYASIFGAWSTPPSNGWMVGYNMNNNSGTQDISLMHRQYSDTYEYAKITNNAMTNWTHFAMVKTGGQLLFYVNGVKVKTIQAGSYTWGGHTSFYCGGSAIRDAAFGTYSNFRVSNIVRYPVPFNPPTSYFEPDANTLCWHTKAQSSKTTAATT